MSIRTPRFRSARTRRSTPASASTTARRRTRTASRAQSPRPRAHSTMRARPASAGVRPLSAPDAQPPAVADPRRGQGEQPHGPATDQASPSSPTFSVATAAQPQTDGVSIRPLRARAQRDGQAFRHGRRPRAYGSHTFVPDHDLDPRSTALATWRPRRLRQWARCRPARCRSCAGARRDAQADLQHDHQRSPIGSGRAGIE